jgi:hypothetical protein
MLGGMAGEKPRGGARRPGASSDPRVEDADGGPSRPRTKVQRTPKPPANPLDGITSFETTAPPPPAPTVTPAPPPAPPAERPPPPAPSIEGTSAIPAIDSPAAAAALLDLGGRRSGTTTAVPTTPPTEPVTHAVVAPPPVPVPERTAVMPVTPSNRADNAEKALEPLASLRAPHRPMVIRRARRPRVRRVTRVVRHVDTWSVFKVAFVFNLVTYVVCLTAGVLLWNVAYSTGTVDNVENFFEQFGWESFEFKGGEIYHNAWIAGLFVAVGLTGFAVLLATLFNLITDLVGGIRVTVLEEEVVAKLSGRGSGKTRDLPLTTPAVQPVPPISKPDAASTVDG